AVETGLSVAGSMVSPETTQLMAQAATLGLILPFSRSQETEADEVGLMYMARAGYDPRAAIDVWRNFAALGGSTVDFLSTHPSPGNRIERLQKLMPEALKVYEASR